MRKDYDCTYFYKLLPAIYRRPVTSSRLNSLRECYHRLVVALHGTVGEGVSYTKWVCYYAYLCKILPQTALMYIFFVSAW